MLHATNYPVHLLGPAYRDNKSPTRPKTTRRSRSRSQKKQQRKVCTAETILAGTRELLHALPDIPAPIRIRPKHAKKPKKKKADGRAREVLLVEEVIHRVFEFLAVRELGLSCTVCTSWTEMGSSNTLWSGLFASDIGTCAAPSVNQSAWRKMYKQHKTKNRKCSNCGCKFTLLRQKKHRCRFHTGHLVKRKYVQVSELGICLSKPQKRSGFKVADAVIQSRWNPSAFSKNGNSNTQGIYVDNNWTCCGGKTRSHGCVLGPHTEIGMRCE